MLNDRDFQLSQGSISCTETLFWKTTYGMVFQEYSHEFKIFFVERREKRRLIWKFNPNPYSIMSSNLGEAYEYLYHEYDNLKILAEIKFSDILKESYSFHKVDLNEPAPIKKIVIAELRASGYPRTVAKRRARERVDSYNAKMKKAWDAAQEYWLYLKSQYTMCFQKGLYSFYGDKSTSGNSVDFLVKGSLLPENNQRNHADGYSTWRLAWNGEAYKSFQEFIHE